MDKPSMDSLFDGSDAHLLKGVNMNKEQEVFVQDKDCIQGKCGYTTTGCKGHCQLADSADVVSKYNYWKSAYERERDLYDKLQAENTRLQQEVRELNAVYAHVKGEQERLTRKNSELAQTVCNLRERLDAIDRQEVVAEVKRNGAGQIYLRSTDGDMFDMSRYIDAKLIIKPTKVG